MNERTAIVIGGGLAGIAAALDLADAGIQVTLLEVRPRLGGAAYSFERDGLWLDNGQHVFLRCCTEYRHLLGRLGTLNETVLQERLALTVLSPNGTIGRLSRNSLPPPFHLAASLLLYRQLRPRERLMAVRAALGLRRVDPLSPAADRQSFGAWLRARGQSDRAIEALWELIGRPTLNLRADDTSLAAAAFVFRTGLLEDAAAGDIGYARAPLQRIHGDAALRVLRDAGVDVRLGLRAERLERAAGGGMAVSGQGEHLAAQAVVVALPQDRAARLLPVGSLRDLRALERLGFSPIVNLHLVYDRPVMRHEFAAAVDSPAQFIFDRTASAGLARGQCLAVSLSAADEQIDTPSETLEASFRRALAELLPPTREAVLERFVITRERFATFRATPGSWLTRPGPQTGISGLALAGAWTDSGWPATMEGAVRSGRAAANTILRSLDRERAVHKVAA